MKADESRSVGTRLCVTQLVIVHPELSVRVPCVSVNTENIDRCRFNEAKRRGGEELVQLVYLAA